MMPRKGAASSLLFTSIAVATACFGWLSTACTTFDDLEADPNKGGPGGGVPNDPNNPATCVGDTCPQGYSPVGAQCKQASNCESKICVDGLCGTATNADGVMNGTETDIDCGGGEPTNAKKCPEGKGCKAPTDCVWGFCTNNVCEGHKPGRKDGDQTDIDCGGTMSPACDWDKSCLVDDDCTSKACGDTKKCLVGPSCKTVHGGSTCGTGEFGDADKQHESCCKTLEVTDFSDPKEPGKKVYVDKYEITAGRMRTFLAALAKANANEPNVQAFMAAHRPKRWVNGWENLLPQSFEDGNATYTVSNPTADPLYPGQDRFAASPQAIPTWSVNSGTQTVDTGINFQLGAAHYFPEFVASGAWPSPDYAATHNLNCSNEHGSYGYSTYWFDNATVAQYSGGVGKKFTKDQMDEKALNCTPFALYAAFCAWDGGQLMTSEVFDYIAGGAWPATPASGTPPPRLAGGNTTCNNAANNLNTFPDGTQSCPGVYFFPDDQGNDFDGSARIAPGGRVPADAIALTAGNEPWMDLIGNLQEATLAPDNSFAPRGYGAGWSSVGPHRLQSSLPRMKAGSFGARCMRFK